MSLEYLSEDGHIDPRSVAKILRTSVDEVAMTVGLDDDGLDDPRQVRNPDIQRRLSEFLQVLEKVTPRLGSEFLAYAWYRSEPLPPFYGCTPMLLARLGKTPEVLAYLDTDEAEATFSPLPEPAQAQRSSAPS